MVSYETECRWGATVVRVCGVFDAGDVVPECVTRLVHGAASGPVVLDLTDVGCLEGPALQELVLFLDAASHGHSMVLVHADQTARRSLRGMRHRLPVFPAVAEALDGLRHEVPAAAG